MPDSATLKIEVCARRAERLLGLFAWLALAIASALLTAFSPLQAAAFFLLASALVVSGLWRQGWLGGSRRLTAINWLPDGRWLLADGAHASMPADLRADSRIGARWLWLRWNVNRACRSMLLLQGDLPPAELRRLVVRLRLQSNAEPAAHDL